MVTGLKGSILRLTPNMLRLQFENSQIIVHNINVIPQICNLRLDFQEQFFHTHALKKKPKHDNTKRISRSASLPDAGVQRRSAPAPRFCCARPGRSSALRCLRVWSQGAARLRPWKSQNATRIIVRLVPISGRPRPGPPLSFSPAALKAAIFKSGGQEF